MGSGTDRSVPRTGRNFSGSIRSRGNARGSDALGPARARQGSSTAPKGAGARSSSRQLYWAAPPRACPDGTPTRRRRSAPASGRSEPSPGASSPGRMLDRLAGSCPRSPGSTSLPSRFGPALQAERDHVTVNGRHAAGQCRVLDRARGERRSLTAHVVEEMEPGESLDEGPRYLARPAGPDLACRPGSRSASSLVNQAKSWFQASAQPPCCGWSRQVAVVDLQDQPALGDESIGPV